MGVDRIAVKQAAQENNFGRQQMKARRHCLRVLAQNPRSFFENFVHARIAAGGRFEDNRCEHGDLHFIRRLRPAHQFVEIVQRKSAQDVGGELDFAAVKIVFAQNQSQRLDAEEITAARVA